MHLVLDVQDKIAYSLFMEVTMNTTKTTDTITVRGREVTTNDIFSVIDRFDREGEAAVLKAEGFRRSTTYWLKSPRSHRAYPSKAVLCIAAGLKASQYFGGAAHTVAVLTRLGFVVRKGEQAVRSVGVDALRAECVAQGFDDPTPEWSKVADLGVTPAAYFASGSNRAGEIRGMAARHVDIGVAAPHVHETGEAELVKLAGSDVQVFVDSGAFSEVKFNTTRMAFDVVKPITDSMWSERLDLYARLADALGEQVWLVAPDQVGSQEVTLERLTRYADRLQQLADTGARIMVVAQKGALDQVSFYQAAVEAAGLTGRPNVVAGLPCKKAATTAAEVASFVAAAPAPHVHLLGKGPTSRDIVSYLAPFANSSCSVSLDSCWITANVDRQRKVRRYTKAQDFAERALVAAGRVAKLGSRLAADVALKVELALALCFGAPLPTAEAARGQLRIMWQAVRRGADVVTQDVVDLLPLVPDAREHFARLGVAA